MKTVTKSKKHPKAADKSNVVEHEKAAAFRSKKMGSEIDDIFEGMKRKRLDKEKGEDERPAKVVAANVRSFDRKKGKSSKSCRSIEQKKKKTADGLPIFTEEELGIGKADAGGTSLCPFDCDCCF